MRQRDPRISLFVQALLAAYGGHGARTIAAFGGYLLSRRLQRNT